MNLHIELLQLARRASQNLLYYFHMPELTVLAIKIEAYSLVDAG
jgi:hypothetical protein